MKKTGGSLSKLKFTKKHLKRGKNTLARSKALTIGGRQTTTSGKSQSSGVEAEVELEAVQVA